MISEIQAMATERDDDCCTPVLCKGEYQWRVASIRASKQGLRAPQRDRLWTWVALSERRFRSSSALQVAADLLPIALYLGYFRGVGPGSISDLPAAAYSAVGWPVDSQDRAPSEMRYASTPRADDGTVAYWRGQRFSQTGWRWTGDARWWGWCSRTA